MGKSVCKPRHAMIIRNPHILQIRNTLVISENDDLDSGDKNHRRTLSNALSDLICRYIADECDVEDQYTDDMRELFHYLEKFVIICTIVDFIHLYDDTAIIICEE